MHAAEALRSSIIRTDFVQDNKYMRPTCFICKYARGGCAFIMRTAPSFFIKEFHVSNGKRILFVSVYYIFQQPYDFRIHAFGIRCPVVDAGITVAGLIGFYDNGQAFAGIVRGTGFAAQCRKEVAVVGIGF